MSFVYLASPYSDYDPIVREQRYQAAIAAAAKLMLDGNIVFSPVAHGHVIDRVISESHNFWMDQCLGILEMASAVYVLNIEGAGCSVGVSLEIAKAHELNIPVYFIYS